MWLAGGAGCSSLHRPVPSRLVPDGGDGGRGGDVVVCANYRYANHLAPLSQFIGACQLHATTLEACAYDTRTSLALSSSISYQITSTWVQLVPLHRIIHVASSLKQPALSLPSN
jgi:GTP1/OBG